MFQILNLSQYAQDPAWRKLQGIVLEMELPEEHVEHLRWVEALLYKGQRVTTIEEIAHLSCTSSLTLLRSGTRIFDQRFDHLPGEVFFEEGQEDCYYRYLDKRTGLDVWAFGLTKLLMDVYDAVQRMYEALKGYDRETPNE